MRITIQDINCFTRSERYVQTLINESMLFCVSGLEFMDISFPDAKSILHTTTTDTPFIAIIPRGTTLDFSFGKKRENWMMFCKMHNIRYCAEKNTVEVDSEYGCLQFPLLKKIPSERCNHFRNIFQNIYALRQSGLPADLLASDSAACALFGEFFALTLPTAKGAEAPEIELLMTAIRQDKTFEIPLYKLYRQQGRSPNYLRKCFIRKFQFSPEDYRLRLKMDTILRLIDENKYSLKEIAAAVGMHNVTHLNSFVSSRYGISPGQLQKQRRGKPAKDSIKSA